MSGCGRRVLLGLLLALIPLSIVRADPPLFLVDGRFDAGGVVQPTRIYDVNPANGQMTLRADIGNTVGKHSWTPRKLTPCDPGVNKYGQSGHRPGGWS